MSSAPIKSQCGQAELVSVYALRALPPSEVPVVEAHISSCAECRHELEALRPIVDALSSWPTDVLRPSPSLWDRLVQRIAAPTGAEPVSPRAGPPAQPEWEEAAPGISCKLLATDTEANRVSMLVRLAPGIAYPPHRHAGREELHLLHGELWIGDRLLRPGDYNRAEPGTADQHVWSETGCTCVLITSTADVLFPPASHPTMNI
jgi:anti-sigma factor ChrR (cupin superfamily)